MNDFLNLYYQEICAVALQEYTYLSYDDFLKAYNEPHRYFHTIEHLEYNFKVIGELNSFLYDNDVIVLTNIFHDIVYYPHLSTNEMRSIKVLQQNWKFSADKLILEDVITCVQDTKERKNPTYYCEIFNQADTSILYNENPSNLMNYEDQIRKEYEFLDKSVYKEKRIEFLESMINDKNIVSIELIIDYIKTPNLFDNYPMVTEERRDEEGDLFGFDE